MHNLTLSKSKSDLQPELSARQRRTNTNTGTHERVFLKKLMHCDFEPSMSSTAVSGD